MGMGEQMVVGDTQARYRVRLAMDAFLRMVRMRRRLVLVICVAAATIGVLTLPSWLRDLPYQGDSFGFDLSTTRGAHRAIARSVGRCLVSKSPSSVQ